MESILTDKKECALCGKILWLEKHHVMHGTANRKLADKDGLWVWLCPECHRGTNGVHNNIAADLKLKEAAQGRWMQYYNKTTDEFIERFGKNYL